MLKVYRAFAKKSKRPVVIPRVYLPQVLRDMTYERAVLYLIGDEARLVVVYREKEKVLQEVREEYSEAYDTGIELGC